MHSSSHQYHPNKLLVASLVHLIIWSKHTIIIQKVRAHIGITGNEITNQLANDGTILDKPTTAPHTHIVHSTILA